MQRTAVADVLAIGLLSILMVGSPSAQTSPIQGEDILIIEGTSGSSTSPRIIALSEPPAVRGSGTSPDWASKEGAFGVGANTTLGGVTGVHLRTWVAGAIVGLGFPLIAGAQHPSQTIDIGVVPHGTPGNLAQIAAALIPGIEGGTDTDAVLLYGPTLGQIGLDFNLGTLSAPGLLTLGAGSRIFLFGHSTHDSLGLDMDGSVAVARFDRETDSEPVFDSITRGNSFLFGNSLFVDGAGFTVWFRGSVSEERFVVVWESYGSPGDDNSLSSIQARIFDYDGVAMADQFQVNTYTNGFQSKPAVAALDDGTFVVVWHSDGSYGDDDSLTSIQARRFDGDGQPLGPEFQVNNVITGFQYEADVAAQNDGGFVVAWTDQPFSTTNIAARQFASGGTPMADQFQVSVSHPGNSPSVAASGDLFMVAWAGGQIYMNGNWILFADGFESGGFSDWSATSP